MYYRGPFSSLCNGRTLTGVLQAQTRHCCFTISRTHLLFKTFEAGWKVRDHYTLRLRRCELTLFAELKKNCSPDLLIYIVGAKADLTQHRQVTSDLARLSLHTWFPPPKPPTPPPPPPPSTLSYIRPRFTSFPGLKSPPLGSPPSPSSLPGPTSSETPAYLDLPSRSSGLQRGKLIGQGRPRTANSLSRSNTSTSSRTPQSSRFGFGGYDTFDNSSNSIEEEDESADDEREWGLSKGMELFEVSAKDDFGKAFTSDLPLNRF